MSGQADSRKVVVAALLGNVAIMVCKFGAAFLSQSTATLAEAVHSVADSGNQGLLLVGMRLAAKPATDRFAFGRAGEKYFWPFVVALMLFSVGGAFGIFEGTQHALRPEVQHGSRLWSYGVLGVSLAFEGMSFRVAWKEFKILAKGKPWREAIREARDPTIPLVLAEDTTALLGLLIAFLAVAAGHLSGLPWLDPLGSILIGLLLCVVAVVLAQLTHALLIGSSATAEEQGEVLYLTESVPGVERVTQVLTVHLGPDVVILTMKLAFRAHMTVEEAEEVTNEVEHRIRARMPTMKKIFIEVDSKGDGRGLEAARRAYASRPAGERNHVLAGPLTPEPADQVPDSGKLSEGNE
jgi:cation diffusion facilitator family transporter